MQVIQRLAKEVRELSRSPPDGVAFVPNDEETLMEVFGVHACVLIVIDPADHPLPPPPKT